MSLKKHDSRKLSLLRSFRVAPEVTSGFVSDFLSSLDCPRALTVAILFREGEHDQLAKLECDPLDHLTSAGFRDSYAATKLLSKFADLSTSYDLDKVALEKFEKFEQLCASTNRRFRALEHDPKFTGPVVWLHNAVIRKISSVLASFNAEEIFAFADWGPGASTLIKASEASAANKFQREAGITRDLYALLCPSADVNLLREAYPLWARQLEENGFPVFQSGNKVVTVPKDATANRVIAIEPGINLWFQKAIGVAIQKRLLLRGIDLRFQSRNQQLALQGSKDLVNATVDFSSASDSISTEVVRAVLPPNWFTLLDVCRSHFGTLEHSSRKWEKFSSMGNGFTFPLQSLIFYAMAISCMEYTQLHYGKIRGEVVSAYGDDVIVPVRSLALFSALSAFYGFSMNIKKTHYNSCFRESCGSHYFAGDDVKPVYLKGRLSSFQTVVRLANAVRRFAHARNFSYGCDARLKDAYERLVKQLPKFTPRIPATLGDGGLVVNFDEATPHRARHWIEGFFVTHVVESGLTRQFDNAGLLLARLWQMSPQSLRNSVGIRGRTRLRFTRSLVKQWYDLGPWF